MDQDIVNITKIKDGFFLGDEPTSSNLDIIIQFKITHMINAAGQQIVNNWESIGIKYLTLNWSEAPNQLLFDSKDEIANRIFTFIEDSFKNGEGILVHSVRGQNRGCIVVIIYLLKKYKWSLTKALEFLTSKKFDADIPKYFLNQLLNYEARLTKINNGVKSNSWADIHTAQHADSDELLVRNSFLNGLSQKPIESLNSTYTRPTSSYKPMKTKLKWADSNISSRKDQLCQASGKNDLYNLKDKDLMKPVVTHLKVKPGKSILKQTGLIDNFTGVFKRPNTGNVKNTDMSLGVPINNNNTNINTYNTNNTLINSKNYSSNYEAPSRIVKEEPLLRQNNFLSNNNNNTGSTRSFTSDQKDKNNNNDFSNTKIIITPVQSIVNNNINNIYIQSPNNENIDIKKLTQLYNNDGGSGGNTNKYIDLEKTDYKNNYSSNNVDMRENRRDIRHDNKKYLVNNPGGPHLSYSNNFASHNDQSEKKYAHFQSENYQGPNNLSNSISQSNKNNLNNSISKNNISNSDYNSNNSNINSNINPNNFNNPNLPIKNQYIQQQKPLNNSNSLKAIKKDESMENNYLNPNYNILESKQVKIIDYPVGKNTSNLPIKNINLNNYSYNQNNPSSQPNSSQNNNLNINKTQNNNEKKNNYITGPGPTGMTNFSQGIQGKNKNGPIKIQNDDKRGDMTNLSTIKMNKPGTPVIINQGNPMSDSVSKGFNIVNQMGVIKRQNSNKPRNENLPSDRPSTAPSKNDIGSNNSSMNRMNNTHNSAKRLPSPVIKSYNLNNTNSKQILTSGSGIGSGSGSGNARYRAPSPQTGTLSKLGLGGSFKQQPPSNYNLKTQKWK